jgi:hypothetical protein
MTEDSTDRRFERTALNMLPYRATSAVSLDVYDPFYSDPFTLDEIVAVRDDPDSPFYIARTTAINASFISVRYYGCTTRDLRRAVPYSALAGIIRAQTTSPSPLLPSPTKSLTLVGSTSTPSVNCLSLVTSDSRKQRNFDENLNEPSSITSLICLSFDKIETVIA